MVIFFGFLSIPFLTFAKTLVNFFSTGSGCFGLVRLVKSGASLQGEQPVYRTDGQWESNVVSLNRIDDTVSEQDRRKRLLSGLRTPSADSARSHRSE